MKRISPSNPEHAYAMPKMHIGLCWGGSALREGASRQVLLSQPEEALNVAADAYLLAKRQRNENLFWTLTKTIAFPVHLLPLEGTLNAHQTKNLMKDILRDNGANLDRLRQIKFGKMDTVDSEEYTPIRHGLNLFTSVLPQNTYKTRKHLFQIVPTEAHAALDAALRNPNNYHPRTLTPFYLQSAPSFYSPYGYNHYSGPYFSSDGATLSEKGWQNILNIVIRS